MLAFNQNEFYISAMLSTNKSSTKVHNGNNKKTVYKKTQLLKILLKYIDIKNKFC